MNEKETFRGAFGGKENGAHGAIGFVLGEKFKGKHGIGCGG